MPNKNKLSIYMLKDEFTDHNDIIRDYNRSILLDNIGTVYIKNSYNSIPNWVNSFFVDQINADNIFTANARAVLLVNVPIARNREKKFAITMGYGKNMIRENVVEERFGLKVILNTIRPDSLRRINKTNIGGNQKLSNEQLPLKSGINDFGLDINRDLVSFITGVSDDEDYAKGMLAGGDILSLSAEVDITNIVNFLRMTYRKYSLATYRTNFGWIDQIQDVRDARLITQLNTEAINAINAGSGNIWMAVPEIINWSEIAGFKYYGRELLDDIYVRRVIESFREPLLSIEQLKTKKISAISSVDDTTKHRWSANRCLYGELFLDERAYCINSGKWYRIDNNFVEQVNRDYDHTTVAAIDFDDFTDEHNSENSYSTSFIDNHPNDYILMDAVNISYGGGRSRIELCDVLSRNMELIHIKPYSGSSTLSHLFSQAAVSAELVLSDTDFLELANERINEISGNNDFQIIDRRSIRVVFGIISKRHSDLPYLPFFSKVSFRYTKRRLEAFGLDVSIKTIRDVR